MSYKKNDDYYKQLIDRRERIMYEMVEADMDSYDDLRLELEQVEAEIDEYEIPLEELEMQREYGYVGR